MPRVFFYMIGCISLAGTLPAQEKAVSAGKALEIIGTPVISHLNPYGTSIQWTTSSAGTTEARIGHTPGLEIEPLRDTVISLSHQLNLGTLYASEVLYLQPFSVYRGDTALAPLTVLITPSASSGEMRALFTRSVDPSVSLGLIEAEFLPEGVDDTLITYIDSAVESIDMAIYNLNNEGLSNITDALNRAHERGVVVRIVHDSNANNFGLATLNPAIGKIESPLSDYPNYGLMHNKFVVFDALASDPMKPFVWTGSANFTKDQINLDPNNVIIIQDQSLAIAYRMEFNEMFGSEGAFPDPEKARFGPDKTDNTPHEFLIAGRRVECYFSPSDGTHEKILAAISSADHSIDVATMLITRQDLGDALVTEHQSGIEVRVLLNDYDTYGEPVLNTLKESLEEEVRLKGEEGIMHHKYMIVDQAVSGSDPLLLTGSHNWSSSAAFRNDENTLIIHDQGIANAYYQEFVNRFAAGEVLVSANGSPDMWQMNPPGRVYPNPARQQISLRLYPGEKLCSMQLLDANGRCVRQVSEPPFRGMEVGGLPEGIYFLRITLEGNESWVEKVILIP